VLTAAALLKRFGLTAVRFASAGLRYLAGFLPLRSQLRTVLGPGGPQTVPSPPQFATQNHSSLL